MKDLDGNLLSKLVKHDHLIATVLSFSRMGIENIIYNNRNITPNVCVIDASHNNLQCLDVVWCQLCPSAWWIDCSFNQIATLNVDTLPYALGSLNLASNEFPLAGLHVLRSVHILRLTLAGSNDTSLTIPSHRIFCINLLPYIWVLDNDFVKHSERVYCRSIEQITVPTLPSENAHLSHSLLQTDEYWGTRVANERETSLLRLMQSTPLDGLKTDLFRLEVLLEDYLEEVRVTSAFDKSNFGKLSSPNINMLQLLSIPHVVRLDLSVLLTAGVLFPLSKQLFKDAMMILLSPHLPLNDILSYCSLPAFVNTALVSVIRRICRREQEELLTHKVNSNPNSYPNRRQSSMHIT
jgi:hypothetical protein